MDRSSIIAEIRRTAEENGGVALGQRRFEEAAGIPMSAWRGRYWRNWSEAVRAAGLLENKPRDRYDDQVLVQCLVELTRKNGRFPTYADLRLARHADRTFPTHHVFSRLGSVEQRIEIARKYAIENPGNRDVLDLLPDAQAQPGAGAPPRDLADGFVYMVRLGKHFKIGKTFSIPRRHREIALELPEKPEMVHAIRTDDPSGIEMYWHTRFAARRANGEWFALARADIAAFKKRRYM